MSRGWFKFWRSADETAAWTDDVLWKVWCACLMKASHKERWLKVGRLDEPVLIQPGQFITGKAALHKYCYGRSTGEVPSASTVWRKLKCLASKNMRNVTLEMTRRFTVVTVCNWGTYQNGDGQDEQQNDTQVNHRWNTGEPQVDTNKKEEKVKTLEKEEKETDSSFALLKQIADHCFIGTWKQTDEVAVKKVIADFGEPMVAEALEKLIDAGKSSWPYLIGIVRNLHTEKAKKPKQNWAGNPPRPQSPAWKPTPEDPWPRGYNPTAAEIEEAGFVVISNLPDHADPEEGGDGV